MLRAIAVDDEETALQWFSRVAANNANLSVAGAFQYPEEALAFVRNHAVDVAFLDVEMPEMSGLELAEQLVRLDPFLRIVFVTAYNQYALDAFRAHAVGYLLKPLDSEALEEQVNHLSALNTSRPAKSGVQPLYVKCFGTFSVTAPSRPTLAVRWKTAKTEELFTLLAHPLGKVKTRESMIETLWPEMDPTKSINLFHVTCTYLRAALTEMGFPDLLQRELDGYSLSATAIDCDVFRFQLATRSLQTLSVDKLEETAALYAGPFLEHKTYLWASAARTQLEADYRRLQNRICDLYGAFDDLERACKTQEQLLLYDPCDESAVTRLVKLRLQAGQRVAAEMAYKDYEAALKRELDVFPSASLRALLGNR
jgi:two-component system, LytTR family, response regulator